MLVSCESLPKGDVVGHLCLGEWFLSDNSLRSRVKGGLNNNRAPFLLGLLILQFIASYKTEESQKCVGGSG